MYWVLFGYIFIIALGLFGMMACYVMGKTRGIAEERSKKVQPICPCTHVFGMHKNGSRCQEQIKVGPYWEQCPCTVYHGPEVVTNKELFNPGTYVRGEISQ